MLSIDSNDYNNNTEDTIDSNTSSISSNNIAIDTINDKKLNKKMLMNYSYPNQDDPNIQEKIYKKREYYYHKVPQRNILTDYNDIKKHRDIACGGTFRLRPQQSLLANFINPDTPFRGLLLYHGLGTGKTCGAIAIAENFKEQVKKYNTKIYVLVPGPLLKENWKNEIIKCTKETYLKDVTQNIGYVNEDEKIKAIKQAKLASMQYYHVITYRSFQKKVLGLKVSEKKVSDDNKLKKVYKKTSSGEFERDIALNKIDRLDNTLLIVDECHNVTGNECGNAIRKLLDNSKNLKIILLSATPMINFAEEIIELVNFIRNPNDPIEVDKVYNIDKTHPISFKEEGKEYLSKMCNGYVSHYRGNNPVTFAEGVDMGDIPEGLLFTHVVRCYMEDFQQKTYNAIIDKYIEDSLDRKSQAASNFCFPILNDEKTEIIGTYGKKGLTNLLLQIKSYKELLNKNVNTLLGSKYDNDIINIIKNSDINKNITGHILKLENLKQFSIKFYTAINNINDLIDSKKGASTAFIYFNLVKVGIELFTEILEVNGYIEYREDGNYKIKNDTRDAINGLTYDQFKSGNFTDKFNNRSFYPSTYITMKGKGEDGDDHIPEIKIKILNEIFSDISNKDGRYIKLVLGSRVMNEGITLENVGEIHVLDVYYNLGKLQQVIGRALRECKHYKITNDENPYPKVKIYRYVVSIKGDTKLSTEEEMYKKAELKYKLIAETERVLKEVAIDCPLNYHDNIFPEEEKKYGNCITIDQLDKYTAEEKKNLTICPIQCNLTKCSFKCFDDKLNLKYYDNTKKLYKKISKDRLDYTTFTNILASNEINFAKDKIKGLYKFRYVYTLNELVRKIKSSYTGEKKELFEDFFVFKALNDLIPINENDFNNFQDTIYDKYNVPGYLIFRNQFYIFQPYDQHEDVPMYYRSNFQTELYNNLSIYNYLKTIDILKILDKTKLQDSIDITTTGTFNDKKKKLVKKQEYDFNSVLDYYDKRPEFDYVGIIDKASASKYSITETIPDIFKLRIKRDKVLSKKRGTGIPTQKGSVCFSSYTKDDLDDIALKLNLKLDKDIIRVDICEEIRKRLLYLEKYSIKDKKMTYVIIPFDHPKYPFPYNLIDRIKFKISKLQDKIPIEFDFETQELKTGIFEDDNIKSNKLTSYIIKIKENNDLKSYHYILKNMKFNLDKNIWSLLIE